MPRKCSKEELDEIWRSAFQVHNELINILNKLAHEKTQHSLEELE